MAMPEAVESPPAAAPPPDAAKRRREGLFGALVLAFSLFWWPFAIEVLAAAPIPLPYYVAWSLFVVACLAIPFRQNPTAAVVIALIFIGLMTVLYQVEWSSRKTFLRDLDRVEEGMPLAEVEQIMAGYIKGTGWPASIEEWEKELTIPDSVVYRHATTGQFDSDWGIVTFHDGRVTKVHFSPD